MKNNKIVKEALEEALEEYIGEPINDSTKMRIALSLEHTLISLGEQGIIHNWGNVNLSLKNGINGTIHIVESFNDIPYEITINIPELVGIDEI